MHRKRKSGLALTHNPSIHARSNCCTVALSVCGVDTIRARVRSQLQYLSIECMRITSTTSRPDLGRIICFRNGIRSAIPIRASFHILPLQTASPFSRHEKNVAPPPLLFHGVCGCWRRRSVGRPKWQQHGHRRGPTLFHPPLPIGPATTDGARPLPSAP